MKESDVQRWVQDRLTKTFGDRLYIFKVPQGQYVSRKGIPDLVGSIDGRFISIEVKMPKGKLTQLQKYEIDKIRKSGSIAMVIYGKDESMIKAIEGNFNVGD